MNKSTKKHLESITVEALMEFRGDCFIEFASSFSRNGSAKIGIDGVGKFVVKTKEETFRFSNPAIAIAKYTEIITQ